MIGNLIEKQQGRWFFEGEHLGKRANLQIPVRAVNVLNLTELARGVDELTKIVKWCHMFNQIVRVTVGVGFKPAPTSRNESYAAFTRRDSLKMTQCFRMLVNAIVKHRDVVRVDQTAIPRAPTGPVPGHPVLKQCLENHPGDLPVRHQSIFVLVEIGFLVDLKIVEIGIFEVVFVQ